MKKISLSISIILAASLLAAGCAKKGNVSLGTFASEEPAVIVLSSPDGSSTTFKSAYTSVKKAGKGFVGTATVAAGGCSFDFTDTWTKDGNTLSLQREVKVNGNVPGAGFYSEVDLRGQLACGWEGLDFIIPGAIYGKPHTSPTAKGGSAYLDAKFFSVRDDILGAPMAAVYDGTNWIAMLNMKPNGATTQEETLAGVNDRIVDGRLGFGMVGIYGTEGDVCLKYRYPGTSEEFVGGFRQASGAPTQKVVRERLHPVEEGFTQTYSLLFNTGSDSCINDTEKSVWRWAWETLDPKVEKVDLDVTRTALLDHMLAHVIRYEDRAGVPFVIDAVSNKPGSFRPTVGTPRPNRPVAHADKIIKWAKEIGVEIDPSAAELDIWEWAVVGFCGKHVEIAGQFLRESYNDNTERGVEFRKTAEDIMHTLVKYFKVNPPIGEGLNIRTGESGNIHGGNSFCMRAIPEDMSMLMELLKAEKEHGYTHEDWLAWGISNAEWLLSVQREDGTIPSDFGSDGKVSDESGVKTYTIIPFFTRLSAFTGDKKYLDAAIKAGNALWDISGQYGVYCGATGNSWVADKESGMLSTNAYLSLYDATGEQKWLDYAVAAGTYTESWIWIWNVPMPIGADPAKLGWKPGVPTIGVNSIGSNGVGGADQYLDWAVPLYAQLYKCTDDKHFLDVANVLLHGTKAMLALPGRQYDMAAPGFQQEHWHFGPVRGIGAHRTWLPWISVNHIHGITGLEDYDKDIYESLK